MYDGVKYVLWRWGRIQEFRVDNGSPFGDPSRQSLSVLHMCLLAHGLHLKVNPPSSPTKNAKVERSQGTTARWSEPAKCANYLELQQRLNEVVLDQREYFPTRVCNGLTRIAAFPQLKKNIVRFDPNDFDITRVYHFLAKGKWIRTVSARGSIKLLGQNYQLSSKNIGTVVTANMNVEKQSWDFFDRYGRYLLSLKIKGITEQHLKNGKNQRQKNSKS